jgi:hypothetical protein
MTALEVGKKLKASGLPVTNLAAQDENTDPNNLLGRPTGYISRASFDLAAGDETGEKYDIDRGGVVEVWPTAAAAKKRADYIQGALADNPILGSEWHYANGAVLVRITGKVKPSEAKRFKAAVDALA